MTMKLTVKNDDATRVLVATTIDSNPETPDVPPVVGEAVEVEPGKEGTFYIHSRRQLVLMEKPEKPE